MPHAHPRRARARAAVVAALVLLPALSVAVPCVADRAYPGWDDFEVGLLLARLRGRTAEHPGRPVELVLGSSRAMNVFDTDSMSAAPGGPVVLNLSLVGGSPLDALLLLRRVVAEGHRPRAVTLEVIPMWLREQSQFRNVGGFRLSRVRAADLALLSRVAPEGTAWLWWDWAVFNAHRWHALRAELLAEVAPKFAPRDRVEQRVARDTVLTPYGWYAVRIDPVPAELYTRGLKNAQEAYGKKYQALDAVDPAFDAVMGEFFGYCREQGIAVRAVVLTPEGGPFRALYGPGVRRRMADHLGRLCRRHGTRLVDAWDWLPDDCFIDGHHMNARGGQSFTRRFMREAPPPANAITSRANLAAAPDGR